MRKFICGIIAHKWAATTWLNDDCENVRYYIYCTRCGKKRIQNA